MTRLARWRGSLSIGDGWAILVSKVGENAAHAHLAHQFTAGMDGDIVVAGGSRPLPFEKGCYVAISPLQMHAILPLGRLIRSVYLDPIRMGFGGLQYSCRIEALAETTSSAIADCRDERALRAWAQSVYGVAIDRRQRYAPLDAALESEIASASPRALATALGVSPSRLRQISAAAFGAPISRVLQWRQVQRAARALAHSRDLADAAAEGGFADQAHFTRRLRRWFGVAPGAGLADLDIQVIEPGRDC